LSDSEQEIEGLLNMSDNPESSKSRARDPRTGRYIKDEISKKLIKLSKAKPGDDLDPDDIVEEIETIAEEAEGAMEHYEDEMEDLKQQVRNLEVQVKIASLSQKAIKKGWNEQTVALEAEREKLQLLRTSEIMMDATQLDIKLPPPEEYDGSPDKLKPFLVQCELVFQGKTEKFQSGKSRILYALSFFNKGEALAWKQMMVLQQKDFLDDLSSQAKTHKVGMWEAAKLLFATVFKPQSTQAEAQQKLLHIKQGNRTVEQYNVEFTLIGMETGIDKTMTLLLWKQGLKPIIKQKIYESGNIPTDFDEWKERAKAIDLGWREYQAESKHYPRETRVRKTFETKSYDRPKLSDEEYQKRRKEGLCYKCGNKGHLANKCFAKARRIPEVDKEQDTQEDF
jgi:hypothetical protein